MPIPTKQIIQRVRDYLNYPSQALVPNHSVMLRLQDKTDFYRTSLNLSDQNWLLSSTRFTVDANIDTLTLSAANYGRPVLCETVDDSNPNHVRQEVPITTIQNQDEYYVGTRTSVGTSIAPHVATSFAIYKNAGTGAVTIRVVPQHMISAEYELWFAPDRPTPSLLANNYPLLEQFINLTVVDAALSLLPNLIVPPTKDVGGGNLAQIAMMERRMDTDKAQYTALFLTAKQQAHLESKSHRLGFGYDDTMEVYW